MSISNTAATTGNLIKNTQDLEFRRHDVDFPSCGVTLRGQLLVPKTEGPHAAIAIAPGMSGVKEGSIMKFAEFFASGGFAVLAYDNINFGSSGGEPRQEVDPVLQRRGYLGDFSPFRSAPIKTRVGASPHHGLVLGRTSEAASNQGRTLAKVISGQKKLRANNGTALHDTRNGPLQRHQGIRKACVNGGC